MYLEVYCNIFVALTSITANIIYIVSDKINALYLWKNNVL